MGGCRFRPSHHASSEDEEWKASQRFHDRGCCVALNHLRELNLERRDRSIDQPNQSPKDVVFAKADNKKCWQAALDEAGIKN
jgi:hypothetical protein